MMGTHDIFLNFKCDQGKFFLRTALLGTEVVNGVELPHNHVLWRGLILVILKFRFYLKRVN
jgi:hypothetical protein